MSHFSDQGDSPHWQYSYFARSVWSGMRGLHFSVLQEHGNWVEDCKEFRVNAVSCYHVIVGSEQLLCCENQMHYLAVGLNSILGWFARHDIQECCCCLACIRSSQYGASVSCSTLLHNLRLTPQCVWICRIIKGGIQCLRLCNQNGGIANVVNLFAEVFRLMHPKDFVELMSARMDYLFDSLLAEPELMTFVALMLDKKGDQGVDKKWISIHFMDLLGSYLVENKLDCLGRPESKVWITFKSWRWGFKQAMKHLEF